MHFACAFIFQRLGRQLQFFLNESYLIVAIMRVPMYGRPSRTYALLI